MKENYYILLGLDPEIKDEDKINEAIRIKNQAWSADRNHPTKGTIAQQYLDKLSDIKVIMLNPEFRKKESEEAKRIIITREQERNKDLIIAGTLLVKNGEISENDFNALLKKPKFKDFTEEQALKILKARVKREEKNFCDDGIQLLDDSTMKKIRSDLKIVDKKDLFDFLSLSPTSSCPTILQKANEIYTSSSRNANKTGEITATNSLAVTCQTYLKTDDLKKRYQKSLEFETLSELDFNIEVAALDKVVSPFEFQTLILLCTNKGIKVDRAEYYISEYCKKRSIVLIKEDNLDYKKQVQCDVCHHLNDPDSNNCGNCGSPLKLICPNCNHQANSIEKACTNCGFNLGDMPNSIYLVRSAQIELTKGNYITAEEIIKESEVYWPGYQAAKDVSDRINEIKTKSKSFILEINKLINERRFISAQAVLKDYVSINKSDINIPAFEKEITEHIAAANSLCKKAQAEPIKTNKLDLFLSALEKCTDYNDAILGSSSLPVDPPTGLKITVSNKLIGLEWQPPAISRALKFRIIRKKDAKPLGVSDGEILIETTNLTYEDSNATPGISYYYSAYSVRGSTFSDKAVTQGPILLLEDIKELSAIAGDKKISFKWEVSTFAKRVEIFRSDNYADAKYGAGEKLVSTSLNNFLDANLVNDKQLIYSFYTVFEDCTGKVSISDGITITSVPSAPPLPVTDLSYTINNTIINLQWRSPEKGTVQIIRSQQKLNYQEGSLISSDQIRSLGTLVANNSICSACVNIDFQGQIFLSPLTIFNQNAIVGKAISVTSVNEVTNVRGQLTGGKLYLEWEWPAGCELVQIEFAHDNYPDKEHASNSTSISFTKDQYLQNSAYVINQPLNRDYYFTIYTCSRVAGVLFLSNGVNELIVNSEIITINYKVNIRGFFGKVATIELRCQEKTKIPETIVILKYAGIPLSKSDGSCILKIANQAINGLATIEIPSQYIAKEKYIKLFFTDDSNYKKFRLQMPRKEELELN